jgi:predicted transcriptional regulator
MRRSKFETYIDVLKVLTNAGPSKITHLMYTSNLNRDVIKEYLDFLIKQRAVEERIENNKRTVFAITQHGINLLNYFGGIEELRSLQREK